MHGTRTKTASRDGWKKGSRGRCRRLEGDVLAGATSNLGAGGEGQPLGASLRGHAAPDLAGPSDVNQPPDKAKATCRGLFSTFLPFPITLLHYARRPPPSPAATLILPAPPAGTSLARRRPRSREGTSASVSSRQDTACSTFQEVGVHLLT